ncbi:MAG: DUF5686 family protein [Melioribacteraceae bacterium]|nr:DUF5686 family protein [Melioribacteraceae bacterium]
MKPRILPSIVVLFFFASFVFPQTLKVHGVVSDKATGELLSYANIRVQNSTLGTSANINGEYELKLQPGTYKLIASFIGYQSDSASFVLNDETIINFSLKPTAIQLDQVTVFPGTNPAIEIIKRAIEAKHKRNELLNSYIYKAYTKGSIRTTQDISSGNSSIGIGIGDADSSELKITGIVENESMGYFRKPSDYKEEIIARKQSSNFPSSINILTGGRILQDFYSDDINFFGRPVPSPIADNALSYYYYYIEDTLAIDNQNVFKIYFAPDDESDPGFFGNVFIADKSFHLLKIDIDLNAAANPGGIFTTVNIFQQFLLYENQIPMPADYRIFAEGNFLGLAKFGFEINTILYDYDINAAIPDDFFDMALIKVLPGADDKDSLYWRNTQTIPNTNEEIQAYARIDSLESVPRTFWDKFSPLSTRISINDNFSMSGPLFIYHFNRTEGHALDLDFFAHDLLDRRFNVNFSTGYGFSDKKIKSEFELKYLLCEYRTTSISFSAYDRLNDLFGGSINYNNLTSTLFNLISKYDFRDYYYSKGFKAEVEAELFPVLKTRIGFINRTDKSASVNTDFSIFVKDKTYRENKLINETKLNLITASLTLDFRKYIEDGYFRRRLSGTTKLPIITAEVVSSSKSLKSDLDFTIFKSNVRWNLRTFNSASLGVRFDGFYSEGPVPYQLHFALPGNINSGGKNFTFRTLRIGEVFGDKAAAIGINHSFNDELFRMLNLPVLKDLELTLDLYANAAWVGVSEKSESIIPYEPTLCLKPFIEAGFGIGQILFPFTLEFTWKLNYRGERNFVIGINTIAL